MSDTIDILIPASVGIIMWGIGLNLTLRDFERVFIQPKAVLTGLSLQMILLPVVGFFIAYFWDLPPAYKVGIVLISACPGGTASNLVTHLLGGRVALSISMTAFNSFLILFSIPIIVTGAMRIFMNHQEEFSISFWHTFQNIGITVIIPVILGILIRHYFKDFTFRIRSYLRYILPAVLLLVFVIVGLSSVGEGRGSINYIAFPLLLLNVITILIGFWLSRSLGITHDGRFTIAIEMGLQNSALAIFIANQVVRNEEMALVAIIYSGFSFFTTLGIAYLLKKSATHVSIDH